MKKIKSFATFLVFGFFVATTAIADEMVPIPGQPRSETYSIGDSPGAYSVSGPEMSNVQIVVSSGPTYTIMYAGGEYVSGMINATNEIKALFPKKGEDGLILKIFQDGNSISYGVFPYDKEKDGSPEE
jgi:hypothetical protein